MGLQVHKVISIVNSKGGVGKTTTALNMAAWLSICVKARVLLIDLDGQANLTACINVDMGKVKGTSYDLLTNESLKAEDIIYKDNSLLFDVIVADDRLNNIDVTLNSIMDTERQLSYKLESIKYAKEIEMGFNELPCVEVLEDTPLVDLLISCEVASSKREAREFISGNAVKINGIIDKSLNFDGTTWVVSNSNLDIDLNGWSESTE